MNGFPLDFVCVGPQKTSTSWLDQMLRNHPHIGLPQQVKETFYFDQFFERGIEWYFSHFSTDAGVLVRGEIGPSYFDAPEAPSRLLQLNPSMRIIVCLRDPVERAYSLYCHHYARGRVKGPFSQAVRQMPRILESGRYRAHTRTWIETFGPERVLLIRQEDVAAAPAMVLARVCQFIGVQPWEWSDTSQAVYERPMPRSLKLAALASRGASLLRRVGLHRVVDAVKQTGGQDFVFGSGSFKYPPLTERERAELAWEFEDEYRWLDTLSFVRGGLNASPDLCGDRRAGQ